MKLMFNKTRLDQSGAVSGVAISLVLAVIFLIAAIGFGAWAFNSRQDYKFHSDQKAAAAVVAAKQQEDKVKDKQFAQDEKYPLRTYNGPEAYGSIRLAFPKTWSGTVDDSGKDTSTLIDGYFYPNIVPSISDQNSTFALRIQVLNRAYADVAKDFADIQQNKDKPVTITPYAFPKLPKVVGVQINGNLPNDKTGIMVAVPLRSETLELWTEGTQYTVDFNNNILPNFRFSP